MESEKPEVKRPEVAAASEISAGLGGVLTYRCAGKRGGICGQTIGEDGAGEYALLIKGTPEQADKYARKYIRELELRYSIEDATFVPNDEDYGYYGNPVRTVVA